MSYRDVTARDEDIRRLAGSEERYRLLAENSTDIVCHVRDGKVVWVSPSIEEALGAPPEYWLGWKVFAHILPEDLRYQAALMARAAAGETVRGRGRVIGADGVTHWLDLHAKPFHAADGRQDGVAATLRLVDDEVAAQRHVEEARRRLEEIRVQQAAAEALERGVIDNSVVATTMSDLAGRFVRVNTAMCDLVGYDADTLGKMTWQDITAPEFLDADLAALGEMISGRRAGVYRTRKQYLHADGHRVWVDATSSLLNAPEGESRGFVTQVIDVTAQTQADERNRALAQELARQITMVAASEERYRLLAENSADVVFYSREDNESDPGIVWVSPNVEKVFGTPVQSWIGRSLSEMVPPEDQQTYAAAKRETIEVGVFQKRGRMVTPSGVEHWVHVNAKPYVDAAGHQDGAVVSFRVIDDEVAAEQAVEERNRLLAQELACKNKEIAASEMTYRLLVENAGDVVVHTGEDNRVIWVSPNVDAVLGTPVDLWIGRELSAFIAAEDQEAYVSRSAAIAAGGFFQGRLRITSSNGVAHWCHVLIKSFFDTDGNGNGEVASIRVVDEEVAAGRAVEQERRERARADARFRRSMDSAAIGMCLLAPDGRFEEVNGALCELFGYDAETLTQKTWQDLTAPEFLADDLRNVSDILAGRIDSYRMIKQYVHADGHRIWGDLSVSCVRDEDGRVENFISQIIDITARVDADERNRVLAQQLQWQNDLTTAELDSAASYMKSIMPRGLAGPVTVSSRYLPSRQLGGDCFDYSWIDDDHLIVYLVDVSGHGIEPALLSVSLHNMLRSGTFTTETLLAPAAVLTELNRLFQMEQQRDHFFTIWYGVYDRPTRALRYASAGAPPAFALGSASESVGITTELTTRGQPIGIFEDTRFTTATYSVPPGSKILLFSDGANEIVLGDGEQMTLDGFKDVVARLAGSPNWTLDDLTDELRDQTPSGGFEDDCSLVLMTFE